ncbi:MAG: VOC family protein [Thermoleophilia bacterium]
MPRATTRITTVGRVIVSVADQDRALDFYEGTLGFEKIADIPFGDGSRWIEVQPPGGGCAIALGRPPEGVPVGGAMTGIVLQTTDIDGDQAALRAAGVDIDDVMRSDPPVPPMAFFRDQDGNHLLLVQSE